MTMRTMSSILAIAPTPVSPHISVFSMHGISWCPHSFSVFICCAVIGWVHMRVFIAGQKNSGLSKSQARVVHNNKLSQRPCAILASVLPSIGAMTRISAHLPRSMWRTGSPRLFHSCHSSSSLRISTEGGRFCLEKKCVALCVVIIFIWNWNKTN